MVRFHAWESCSNVDDGRSSSAREARDRGVPSGRRCRSRQRSDAAGEHRCTPDEPVTDVSMILRPMSVHPVCALVNASETPPIEFC